MEGSEEVPKKKKKTPKETKALHEAMNEILFKLV